jgi:hypothetical protein
MSLVKAAMHAHSEWSYDARMPLEEVAALFARHGYDVVFMCEHDRGFTAERKEAYDAACADASRVGALLVPGIEYADAPDRVHTPVWGPLPFLGEGIPTAEVLLAARNSRCAAVIAHPVRREAWRVIEPEWLQMCAGIEIWTRKWDGWAPNRWAAKQAHEHGLAGVVSLDLHNRHQMFPLAMELEVDTALTTGACVDALRRRRCRALVRGLPVAPVAHGPLARAAGGVEKLRRPIWRRGRLVRNRLTGAR